ncbi:uncharacterized protein LOC118229624 [Anguilla anguilla]|uniref:uncharacterized protein LOC118229624 n=1 Tax=Anguilla anguilla TaxID=7936 RepID=UPI0015B35589|nr:uncharacterized protein LOC118229624 [Anguilla anguilla]
MMLHCLLLLFSAMVDESFQDEITPAAKEVHVLVGNKVKLSCTYTAAASYLYWYRQYPQSKPEFLIFVVNTDRTEGAFTAKHDKNNKTVHLEISSAEVTDSALYYCAGRDQTVSEWEEFLAKSICEPKESTMVSPAPCILILIYVSEEEKTDKRFTVKHDKKNRRVHLEISSAEVTDSALYYCALEPTVTVVPFTPYKNLTLSETREQHKHYFETSSLYV